MVFIKKRTPAGDTGSSSQVGADDWNILDDYFDSVDITPKIAKINTQTQFRSGKRKLMNPANTFAYVENTSAITADRAILEPLLAANDTRVYQAFAQPLTNKTIDVKDNTFAGRSWTVLCFKLGTTYYALKHDGTVLSSGSVAETVINAAITQKGIIYFANTQTDGGTDTLWNCSGAFTGFSIPAGVHLIAEGDGERVWIGVPQNFTGTAITFSAGGNYGIKGLAIYEQGGTEARNWTALKLTFGSGESSVFCQFEDVMIWDCSVGIEIETTDASAYFNSNLFKDITIWSPRKGVVFDQQTGDIDQNKFDNVNIQCMTGVTTHGFQNIDGTSNIFVACSVWDMDVSNSCIETSIKPTADGTIIIGGRMTGNNGQFVNQGNKTLILATFQGIAANAVLTPDIIKYGSWVGSAPAVTNADGLLNGRLTESVVGTGTSSSVANSTGSYRDFDTGATTGGIFGHRMGMSMMQRINNCYFKTALYLNNTTGVRIFAGFKAGTGAPTASADPLNAVEGCALWLDSAVSSSWKVMHNDGVGSSTVDSLTVTAASGTLYPVEIYARSDNRFRVMFNGVSTDYTTNIPASTTNLAFYTQIESTTSGSKTMRVYYEIIRNDK